MGFFKKIGSALASTAKVITRPVAKINTKVIESTIGTDTADALTGGFYSKSQDYNLEGGVTNTVKKLVEGESIKSDIELGTQAAIAGGGFAVGGPGGAALANQAYARAGGDLSKVGADLAGSYAGDFLGDFDLDLPNFDDGGLLDSVKSLWNSSQSSKIGSAAPLSTVGGYIPGKNNFQKSIYGTLIIGVAVFLYFRR